MPFDSDVLNGFKQPSQSTSTLTNDNQLALYGTVDCGNGVAVNGAVIGNSALANVVTTYSAAGAVAISGKALIVGGTGFALTLAAPQEGCFVDLLLSSITSGSVTYAVRDTKVDGVEIKKDAFMGLVEDKIVTSNEDEFETVKQLLSQMITDESEIITMIIGEDANSDITFNVDSENK